MGRLANIFTDPFNVPEFSESILSKDILPKVGEYVRHIQQPVAAASSAIPHPLEFLPEHIRKWTNIPGTVPERELEARRGIRGELGQLIRGEKGFRETSQALGELQRTRPGFQQLSSEIFSPLGLAESAIPIGKIASIGGKIAGPTIRTRVGVAAVPRLPDTGSLIKLANDPKLSELYASKPGAMKALHALRPGAIGDVEDVVYQFAVARDVGTEIVADSANMMTLQVLKMGNPKNVFSLADDFTSNAPGLEGRFFNDIVQNANEKGTREALTPEMTTWFDNFKQNTDAMKKYLVDEGVQPEDWLLESGPGNYFPNVWATLNDIKLVQTGGKALGAKQFYEKTRFYEEALDALKEGFRPADPMASVALLYQSMYKQVLDKKLIDILKPYSKTIKERMDPSIIHYQRDIRAKAESLQALQAQLPKIGLQIRRLRAGRPFAGRATIEKYAPDLLEDFDAALRTRKPHTRERAWRNLEAKLTTRLDEAQKNKANVDTAYKRAKARAGARRHLGEVQFPMTGLSGRIFSVDDILHVSNPEVALTDLTSLNRAQIQELSKLMRTQTKGFLDTVQDISSMSRSLQAGLDLGVMAIHGAPLALTQPALWAKTTGKSLQLMTDPTILAKEVDLHWDTVLKLLERNQLHGGGSEYVQGLGKAGLLQKGATWVGERNVPGAKPTSKAVVATLNAVEAQFNGFLTLGKIYLWEALEPTALRQVNKAKALDDLASHVSKFFGTISMANMGFAPTSRKLMGTFMMFAPRYRMAVYGLMADVLRPGYKGDLARKSMGKMMATGLLTYSAIAARLGQTPNLDPTSSKFLTLQIGNDNIGIGSAFVSTARFATGFLKQAIEDPEAAVRIDRRDNKLQRFVRGQISPISGTAWDVISGRDYIGDPTTGSALDFTSNVVAQRLMPFWMSGFADQPRPGILSAFSEFGGLRSFPVSLYERAIQTADVYAHQQGDISYRDMNRLEQDKLRKAHPDVQDMMDENNQIWEAREVGLSAKMADYRNEAREYRDNIYNKELETAMAAFQKQTISPKEFRQKVKELGAGLGSQYNNLEKRYPEVIEAFNEESQNPDAHLEDIAYNEYISTVIAGNFEVTDPESQFYGQFDFDKRRDTQEFFQQKWGNDIWSYVQARLDNSRERKPLMRELYEGRQALEAYWRIGDLMLEKMDRADLVPEWKLYLRMRTFEQEEYAEDSPGTARLFKEIASAQSKAREIHRERNPDIEAFLFRWGYIDKLRNLNNLAKEPIDIARTPILLRQ